MVGYHDETLGKVKLHSAVGHLFNLAGDRLVAADADNGAAPDARDDGDDEAKGALCHGHVGVEHFLVDKVQRGTNQLRSGDPIGLCASQ